MTSTEVVDHSPTEAPAAEPTSAAVPGRGVRPAIAWSPHRLHPLTVTAAFLALLFVTQHQLAKLDGPQYTAAILGASTNLVNLEHGRVSTLATSAVVGAGGTTARWWATVAAVLAAGELCWGGRRLAAVFLAGHIGATLLVAGGLAFGEWQQWLPASWMSAPDVGISYGMVAIAGALATRLPRYAAIAWAGCWAALLLREFVAWPDFTDAGHLCALAIGLSLSRILNSREVESHDQLRGNLRRHPSSRYLVALPAAAGAWALFHSWIV